MLGLFGGTQRYLNDKVTISHIAICCRHHQQQSYWICPKTIFFYNEYNAREGDNYQVARIVNYAILIKQMQGSKTSSAKRLPDVHMLLITDPLIFIGSINSCGIKDYNRVLYNHEFFVVWVFTGQCTVLRK